MRTASKVLTISRFSRNVIKQFFGVDADIVYPPVDVETFNKAYLCKDRENLVLVLGRVTKEKRQDLAIHAISKLEGVKLAVVGSTVPASMPYVAYLRRLVHRLSVEDRVEFHLNASLGELLEIMGRAKVLLHPMRGEHFGIAIVEGMAAGLIPVVWDYGGQSEFTLPEFQFHSVKEIPEKISLAVKNYEEKRELCHILAQKFSEENFKVQFSEVIEEVAWRGAKLESSNYWRCRLHRKPPRRKMLENWV